MNKKGSILVMGIFFVFFLFIMALYISQTVQKMSFDRTAGEDAMTLDKLEVASYRHRFFLEHEGEKILNEIEMNFNDYLDSKISKSGDFYVISNDFLLKELAYDLLLQEFDKKLDESIKRYNQNQLESEYLYSEYLIDYNINYSFYSEGNYVYAYALQPTYVRTGGKYSRYYYWPHIRMESDFFKNIELPYDAKFLFEKCYALKGDLDLCEDEIQTKYSDYTINVKLAKSSLLPQNAILDTLVQDPMGHLLVKVDNNGMLHYESSNDLGKTWNVDIDSDVLVSDATLYDKYLADSIFKKYTLNEIELINFYFDDFLFILT